MFLHSSKELFCSFLKDEERPLIPVPIGCPVFPQVSPAYRCRLLYLTLGDFTESLLAMREFGGIGAWEVSPAAWDRLLACSFVNSRLPGAYFR